MLHLYLGLPTEVVHFNLQAESPDDMIVMPADDFYLLRPEIAEDFFYMYRGTKDPRWRDLSHQLLLNIRKHAKTEYGYSSVSGVHSGAGKHFMDDEVRIHKHLFYPKGFFIAK